ncbi:response regulator transcription factor [Pseudoteredinibacter isoporae]|uniref:Two-component system OmpR family response regulator n=1 Tax=Pseudoteredinibacter isoporae TaxID=570281 RepID=A0A7X0MXI8_9GAMM|nr:response regulator transcription factor [Pseudoteredinibacter isoporae]MBB6520982.1 two-component system OmpR family response regulator [Pseudoteredinibacter isoporae]NHO86547.1 response regulator transcription factor [Pseudoteredinibacter isoporae]NIB25001.1 response regulator transcription factor [Pseudoteredinibacter isoporae]
MKILLVEDNQEQAQFICKGMQESGHCIDWAKDGREGFQLATQQHSDYQLIICDRLMPEMDGLHMLKALRAINMTTPVLILSALDSVDERVKGLRSGGDDYLVKPFAFSELLARAEILASRFSPVTAQVDNSLSMADLELDRMSRKACRAGKNIELNTREFHILEYFLQNPGRVITRTMLLEQVWGHNFDPQTNVIDVHISRLRKKIDSPGTTPLLHTVRGAGYKMEVLE